MSHREKILLWGRTIVCFILIALGPLVFFWVLLRFGAWYVRNIPARKLPLTGYIQGWPQRFYEWLSGFLTTWAFLPMLVSFLLVVLNAGVFIADAIGFLVLPFHISILWIVLNLVAVLIYYCGFYLAKAEHWEQYIWQAEPTAEILVGSFEEYNKLSDEDKEKIKRHVADIQIGINKGSWLVRGGRASMTNAPAGVLARFGGPGVLVTQEGHAVILERSGMISRIVGHRTTFLEPFETVSQVVYLGTQMGAFEFEHLITKDRVVIERMEVVVFYKVDPGRRTSASGIYSFDKSIIIGKIWSAKSSVKDDKSANLEGNVRAVTNSALRDLIAQYNLEDVITATGKVRQELRSELRKTIEGVTKDIMGILILVVDIGKVVFPSAAREKLLERWNIDWQAQIDQINTNLQNQAKISDAEARHKAEEWESAIAKMQADTKKYQDVVEAQAKRDAALANVEAEYEQIIAVAEAKRMARLKAGEAEEEYLKRIGNAKAAVKRAEAVAEAEGEAEKLRHAASVMSSLDPAMAKHLLAVYGNTLSRYTVSRLIRQMEMAEAMQDDVAATNGSESDA